MRITPEQRGTPEQQARIDAADRALSGAVARYLRLDRQTNTARKVLYRSIYEAWQVGMRQVDIVDSTVGLGVKGKPWTREHVHRVIDKVALELRSGTESDESDEIESDESDESDKIEHAAAS